METSSRVSTEQGVIVLQYLARALFAILAVLYFNHSEGFFFTVPTATPWILAGSYLALQLLFLVARVPHATILASGLDLVILGIVILLDGGEPPPTMALLFLAVLSNGLLHGLKRFLVMLAAAEVVLAIVMPIRISYSPGGAETAASASLFLLAALTVCMLYFGLMIWRNQVLSRQAVETAWRDPQTGFISRTALTSTAGWLIPLHDRLSSPLTLVLVHHLRISILRCGLHLGRGLSSVLPKKQRPKMHSLHSFCSHGNPDSTSSHKYWSLIQRDNLRFHFFLGYPTSSLQPEPQLRTYLRWYNTHQPD